MRQVLGIVAVGIITTLVVVLIRRDGSPPSGPVSPTPTAAATLEPDPVDPVGLTARDSEDDTEHPELAALFPSSNRVGNWIKVEPVQVVGPDDLSEVLGDRTEIFRPYGIALAGVADYASPVDSEIQRCTVEIIEALSSVDAYGMLTVCGAAGEPVRYGVAARRTKGGLEYFIWQDKLFIHVRGEPIEGGDVSAEAQQKAVDEIAASILFDKPRPARTVLPEILGRFPLKNRIADQHWVVRGLASLDAPGAGEVPLPADSRELVSNLLRLGPDSLMAIVAYNVPDGLRPNCVWAVEYKDPREANDARHAYTKHLDDSPGDPLSRVTLVVMPDPRRPYILGTWTAEEESLSHALLDMTDKAGRRR